MKLQIIININNKLRNYFQISSGNFAVIDLMVIVFKLCSIKNTYMRKKFYAS